MSTNVSSNFSAFVPPNAGPIAVPAAPTGAPTPALPQDSMQLSAQALAAPAPVGAPAPAVSAATPAPVSTIASPDLRAQLLQLRQELMTINNQIDSLTTAMNAQTTTPAAPVPPAAPVTPAAPTASGVPYTVQAGDTLSQIAQKQLGDAGRWQEIYALNKDVIGANPNLIFPGQVLKMPGAAAPAAPAATTPATTAPTDHVDVPAQAAAPKPLTAQNIAQITQQFGLSSDPANVQSFLSEMDSYDTSERGKVFGPGMEKLATSQAEATRIQQSVGQIQQALNMEIQAGKLKPVTPDGKPVTQIPVTGTYFQVNPQGQIVNDAQGNPVMDPAFVAAITQFKQDSGIHQNYKLADGTYAINEYVGPTTLAVLKTDLAALQTPAAAQQPSAVVPQASAATVPQAPAVVPQAPVGQ